MTKEALFEQIQQKQSFLCVGLDTDIKKIPTHLLNTEDPIFEFNKEIIDATKEFAVAYKPNIAFYEAMGAGGWASLEKTINYIPKDIFTIADAKRGDIGNTSSLYARAFFDNLNFDSVTVAPYMGSDSVKPFLEFKDKWVILLGVTSNEGGKDFQFLESEGKPLYQHVMETSSQWGTDQNMMYVVGATRPEYLQDIRKIIPDHFLLVPGVGAQGGDLQAVCENGMNDQCGLLINSTRGIIYASSGKDFAEAAHNEAKKLQAEMAPFVETLK
ncbi:MAG: orotidine-5'-phosphate decarboxylase [Reichenbachiella sp.]|uniref:orotidine-5'-phosphate decarboxylase n=1 Tax=Reichenbachiella sp. TaxID=2184521 RepID=UPI002967131F|nr:orotidine-5'-phosphate decarboxylase [Reichenbachiella sp.]MDW3209125.1 orotidine-5'-phosphate decarboxylase [Reichenbachiella sp.]